MKIKNILAIVFSIILLLPLTACQLAKKDAAQGKTHDLLVGVFITTEHLDLFDMEGYLNDNLGSFSGGEIALSGNSDQYNGRLYATPVVTEHTDDETGKKSSHTEYVFEDLEGIPFFVTETPALDNTDGTVSSVQNEGMSDGHFGSYSGDDEDKTTLDGTLYFAPKSGGSSYYFNPVYQSADGKIYVMAGQGMSSVGDQAEGSAMSQKFEDTVTTTENGQSKKKTTIINITIESMLPPEKILLLEFDENSALLSRTEYAHENLPESITPNSSADFILLESHKLSFDGTAKVDRTLFSRSDESIECFYQGDNNILVKQYSTVNWQ
ncbi:MAG: hypothetical protein RR846_06640 [Oscillospiraceae bacterium]